MSKKNPKLYSPQKSNNEKLYSEKRKSTGVRIGITYLDHKHYGLQHLFRVCRGNRQYLSDFEEFLYKAKQINNFDLLIKTFGSHKKLCNEDKRSKDKVKNLQEEYNLEVDNLIHLHCKGGGSGEFVLHGFQIDNVFEIVWLDPTHDIHDE